MAIPDKKLPTFSVPSAGDSPHEDPEMPDAALPGSWNSLPSDAPGNTWSLEAGAEGYKKFFPIDPQIPENKFPRESGSDSYSGIPGDGVVGG